MHSPNAMVAVCARKHSQMLHNTEEEEEEEEIRNSQRRATRSLRELCDDDDGSSTSALSPGSENRTVQSSHGVPSIVLNHQSCYSPQVVERMRRKLRFFFMNPIEKWQAKGRFPWKLLVQIVKIIIVTIQVGLFGTARYSHVSFYNDNQISLSHLFLRGWDFTQDIKQYPPALGPFAVFRRDEFYASIDFAVRQYATLRETAVGAYYHAERDGSIGHMEFCKTYFKEGVIFGFNESYVFDADTVEDCLDILPVTPLNQSEWCEFNSESYFKVNNFTILFDRLIKAELKFALTTILLKSSRPFETPDCFKFDITIYYDNENHDGQLKINLNIEPIQLECHGSIQYVDSNAVGRAMLNLLNVSVILICLFSLLLCSRAMCKAGNLIEETTTFFKKHFGTTLTLSDKLEFVNLWYILIIINDITIIAGSAVKMQIENKMASGDMYNAGSVLLGTGTLLVWFGVLRYLSFFPKYNILILTMRRAAPDVLRFLLCAVLIYAGFVFSGWLILGPYHIKFQTLSGTSECLFALINGDDMYATFTILLDKSGKLIWWYSRIYFYSFIALFIYVVLAVFIAVIMDTYETIKKCYEKGFPKSCVMEFVSECLEEASSGVYRNEEDSTSWTELFQSLKNNCWCWTKRRQSSAGYQPI